MIVKISGTKYDVADAKCATRPCFQPGINYGTWTRGFGYTSTHEKPQPDCTRRRLSGCPDNSICPICRLHSTDAPGSACESRDCDGVTIRPEVTP